MSDKSRNVLDAVYFSNLRYLTIDTVYISNTKELQCERIVVES